MKTFFAKPDALLFLVVASWPFIANYHTEAQSGQAVRRPAAPAASKASESKPPAPPKPQAPAPLILSRGVPGTEPYQPGGKIEDLAVSQDVGTVAVCDGSKIVRLYDGKTGKLRKSLDVEMAGSAVSLSPDGNALLIASIDLKARLFDIATGALKHSFNREVAAVHDVAFAPDGKSLALAQANFIALADPQTGKTQETLLTGFESDALCVAFSPDSKRVAAGGKDRTVRFWDTATGHLLHTLEGHSGPVREVSWSPDGKLLASAGDDGAVRLWETETGTLQNTWETGADSIRDVAFAPSGQSLALAPHHDMPPPPDATTEVAQIWDKAKGRPKLALRGETEVNRLLFMPDGKGLLVGDSGGLCAVYAVSALSWAQAPSGSAPNDLSAGAPTPPTPDPPPPTPPVKPKTPGAAQTGVPSNTGAGSVRTLPGDSHGTRSLVFSPDGKLLAAGNDDTQVLLWTLPAGQKRPLPNKHKMRVTSLAFSTDGQMLASGGEDLLQLNDLATGKVLWTDAGWASVAGFDPFGIRVLGVTSQKPNDEPAITRWDSADGKDGAPRDGDPYGVKSALSPDGSRVAVARLVVFDFRREQSEITLYDAQTSQELGISSRIKGIVTALTWSPNGQDIAVDSGDYSDGFDDKEQLIPNAMTVKIFDANSIEDGQNRERLTLNQFTGPVEAIAYAPDGATLVTASHFFRSEDVISASTNPADGKLVSQKIKRYERAGQTVTVWDAATGKKLAEWFSDEPLNTITTVACSPDGKTIAIGRETGPILLWRWK